MGIEEMVVTCIGAVESPRRRHRAQHSRYQNGIILVTSNRISVTSAPGADMTFTYSRATAAGPSILGFNPVNGPAGTSVTISGANFTGATAVRFNGVSASFEVDSPAQITALVPVGTTTGLITVITAGGTATSAASFTVIGGAPANDDLANGRVLIGGAGTAGGDNSAATKEPGEPHHAGNTGGKSVWYYWTAPGSGPMTMDTAGGSFNTLLGVYGRRGECVESDCRQ
jgi:hypothetical protein